MYNQYILGLFWNKFSYFALQKNEFNLYISFIYFIYIKFSKFSLLKTKVLLGFEFLIYFFRGIKHILYAQIH
jgi:hypothetical protein